MVQCREQLLVEPMRDSDVPTVHEIDRSISLTPWPRQAYYRELSSPLHASYLVLRHSTPHLPSPTRGDTPHLPSPTRGEESKGSIVGYAGMWRAEDEAHVTTLGIRPDLQGQGYGRVIFASLLQEACRSGSRWVTLEVRASNFKAISLYMSFGFKTIGCRLGYYTDNRENALVMWSDAIYAPSFRSYLERNWNRISADVELKTPSLTLPARGREGPSMGIPSFNIPQMEER